MKWRSPKLIRQPGDRLGFPTEGVLCCQSRRAWEQRGDGVRAAAPPGAAAEDEGRRLPLVPAAPHRPGLCRRLPHARRPDARLAAGYGPHRLAQGSAGKDVTPAPKQRSPCSHHHARPALSQAPTASPTSRARAAASCCQPVSRGHMAGLGEKPSAGGAGDTSPALPAASWALFPGAALAWVPLGPGAPVPLCQLWARPEIEVRAVCPRETSWGLSGGSPWQLLSPAGQLPEACSPADALLRGRSLLLQPPLLLACSAPPASCLPRSKPGTRRPTTPWRGTGQWHSGQAAARASEGV